MIQNVIVFIISLKNPITTSYYFNGHLGQLSSTHCLLTSGRAIFHSMSPHEWARHLPLNVSSREGAPSSTQCLLTSGRAIFHSMSPHERARHLLRDTRNMNGNTLPGSYNGQDVQSQIYYSAFYDNDWDMPIIIALSMIMIVMCLLLQLFYDNDCDVPFLGILQYLPTLDKLVKV